MDRTAAQAGVIFLATSPRHAPPTLAANSRTPEPLYPAAYYPDAATPLSPIRDGNPSSATNRGPHSTAREPVRATVHKPCRPAQQEHSVGVSVVRPAIAILARRASKLGHRRDHRVFSQRPRSIQNAAIACETPPGAPFKRLLPERVVRGCGVEGALCQPQTLLADCSADVTSQSISRFYKQENPA